ncbi:MAG: hypothetical protein JNK96_02345 [Betaproteobacteria bacterium]|nr:hypothetical protein [Betaproteobacteria bacterium]
MSAPSTIETPSQIRMRDPLSEITRKERRALLATALLGVAIVKTGLLPSEITALGIKFAGSDQRALLVILAIVIAYLLVAFIIYAASDFLAWRLALHGAIRERMLKSRDRDEYEMHVECEVEDQMRERFPFLAASPRMVLPVSIARAIFEFILPLAVGAYAIYQLLEKSVPSQETHSR